jgi:hypothetical protein
VIYIATIVKRMLTGLAGTPYLHILHSLQQL